MKAVSLFSGAGGMDLGFHAAGIETISFCEIDAHARSVLAHHWPTTPIEEDVTNVDPAHLSRLGRADIVHGGSPCQDLSVAGKRAGLDGARSGLFWHQCRIADALEAPWVVWENVAGALSSNRGNDFAAVLWGLTGMCPRVPDGGKWRNSGVVVGPKRWAVWRVLDAQFFGVPQRRRRVFVVAGVGDGPRPEVLLECEGLRWDPAPRGEAGEKPASPADGRSRGGGLVAADGTTVGSLTQGLGSGGPDAAHAQAGWLVPDKAGSLLASTSKAGYRIGADEAAAGHIVPAKTGTVTTNWGKGPGNTQVEEGHVIPFVKTHRATSSDDHEIWQERDVAPTFDAGASNNHTVAVDQLGVRRLTPLEAERLQGWPDDHTRWNADGEIAATHRYRMVGNGVASPVAEWVARRIVTVTPS